MRPKKTILLAGLDPQRVSELAYMLTIQGYAVTAAQSTTEAATYAAERLYDVLLLDLPLDGFERLIHHARLADRDYTQCIALKHESHELPDTIGFSAVMGHMCPAAELLDRLKVTCARKRGPRKGVGRALPVIAQPAVVAQEAVCA
jgi:DNA-binding response OmpR family regulator